MFKVMVVLDGRIIIFGGGSSFSTALRGCGKVYGSAGHQELTILVTVYVAQQKNWDVSIYPIGRDRCNPMRGLGT